MLFRSTIAESPAGTYTVTTAALADGQHSLSVTITDAAGNVSPPSDPATVTVDTQAPAKPAITAMVEDTNVSDDDVTSDTTLTFTVAGESGATLALFQDGTEIVPGSVTDNGDDTYTVVTQALADAGSDFTVSLTDTAGNLSPTSDAYSVVVDTVAPAAPSLVLLNDSHNHAGVDGDGSSDSDGLTRFDVLDLEVTGEPGGQLTVMDGVTDISSGSTIVESPAGTYTVTTPALSEGAHSLSVTITDLAGNVSASTGLSVTVDQIGRAHV